MGFNMRLIAIIPALLAMTNISFAASDKDTVIDNIINAYGGEAFLALETLKLEDHYADFRSGQSYSPLQTDTTHYVSSIAVDFKAKQKSLRWIRGSKPDFSIQHQLFDGATGYQIDHNAKSITETSDITFANVDRRIPYHWDIVLAKLLVENRSSAEHAGMTPYKGQAHEIIRLEADGYPKFTLMINAETYLITQMQRPDWIPGQTFTYLYSDHRIKDGIAYANSSYLTRGGKPYEHVYRRTINMNASVMSDFKKPNGYGAAAPTRDFAEMTIQKLSENLYMAGQDWGFSVFYDAGDHYIAAGGYDRLPERLKAVQDFAGNAKPLKYQIVTHHHIDHLSGMQEAAELGATFITVEQNVEPIRIAAKKNLSDDRFILVDGELEIAGGAIKIADFPNGHANHNLVPYFIDAKAVFTADLFFSRQIEGAPDGDEDLRRFRNFLNANDFQTDFFAASHSGRILTAADLNTAIATISEENLCPRNWDICDDYN